MSINAHKGEKLDEYGTGSHSRHEQAECFYRTIRD
jgi:hypothetical protein